MASVIACVLDGHAGDIGTMIARESRDACAITTVLGLAGGLPGVCFGP
jgi:predicted RNA-binding protein YlqC (UPF0109 family)